MLLISTPSDKGGSDVHHHDSDGAVGFTDELQGTDIMQMTDRNCIEQVSRKLKPSIPMVSQEVLRGSFQ